MEESKNYIRELVKRSEYSISSVTDAEFISQHEVYLGTPKRVTHDSTKLLLIEDPFIELSRIYEFSIKSISFIEEVESITSHDARTAMKVKIWVKKGSIAIESKPYYV